MSIIDTIKHKLQQEYAPELLEVVDESYKHAGHASAPEGGESHFSILLISKDFSGKSRLERHKMVYTILEEELSGPIHALRFEGLLTPEEYDEKS